MKFFLIAILISALAFVFAVKPFWQQRTDLQSELLNLQSILDKKIALQEKMQDLVLKYTEAQDYEKNINLAVPNSVEEENLIAQIGAIAKQSGVIMVSMDISKQEKGNAGNSLYKETSLGLSIKGSFASIGQFLGYISQSMRIIEILSIDLRPQQEVGDIFSASIKGKTFYK